MIDPPKIFLRFFRWFCHPKLRDSIEGDLMELYNERVSESKRKADFRFAIDVLLLFRPGIIRPAQFEPVNSSMMYKSYLKIGWRNLLRTKGYSLINVGGLAIGMAVAILNGLWIWDELSFNKNFQNSDYIAQISEYGKDSEREWYNTTMTYPLSTTLIENHSENFKHIVRASFDFESILAAGENKISGRGLYTDKGAPEMFSFKMISGSRGGLNDALSMMISSSMSKALFGETDALGKTVRMNNKTDLTVTGVYEDFPLNSELYGMKFFASWNLFLMNNKWIEQRALTDWRNHFIRIYVQIVPTTTFDAVSEKIKNVIQFDPADYRGPLEEKPRAFLYPMSQWHLHPFNRDVISNGPVQMLWLVGSIGVFVLLLACINFINLSTARSEKRMKEVGIRKTIGTVRSQLVQQFFIESFMVVALAFGFSLIIAYASLPLFNDVSAKMLGMPWTNSRFWLICFGFIAITGILAGSYPALFLSSFQPVEVLKGTLRFGKYASLPRKVLVVFQFAISVILIAGTVIVYQQVEFAKNRPVNYTREGVITIQKKSRDFYGKYDVLRNELINTGAVEEISESMGKPTEVASGNNGWDWKGKPPELNESFGTLAVSHAHGKTLGWEFVHGRDFSRDNIGDSNAVVLNESAAKIMGLANPIGEPLSWTWWTNGKKMDYTIIGIVKDMVMDSPYEPVEPTIFYIRGFNGSPSWINIRMNRAMTVRDALPKIEAVFKKVIPEAPFDYKFVDEEYALKFAAEERIGKLALIFSGLAIFISCLGLFGLASFIAERRTKEIGIRKVVGASVPHLWRMLSKDFVILIIVSSCIALPVAWYTFSLWLQRYPFRIEISPWTLLAIVAGAVMLTLLTVSYQAIKAATTNPVKSLRSE